MASEFAEFKEKFDVPLQVVLLGSAPDPRIQGDFTNLANQLHSSHGDRARLCLTYDEPLSHLVSVWCHSLSHVFLQEILHGQCELISSALGFARYMPGRTLFLSLRYSSHVD